VALISEILIMHYLKLEPSDIKIYFEIIGIKKSKYNDPSPIHMTFELQIAA
jgi:hypothetical protein